MNKTPTRKRAALGTARVLSAAAVIMAAAAGPADAMVFHSAFGQASSGIGSPTNPDGQFSQPQGIGVDALGTVYVADGNNKRIQKFDRQGTFLGKWTSLTTGGLNGNPVDVAADTSRVWVIEQSGGTARRYSPQGTLATTGTVDVTVGSSAGGIGLDAGGNLIHSSYGLSHLRRYTFFADTWSLGATWGTAGTGSGQLARPMGVAASPDGTTIYVAERDANRVQRFSTTGAPQGAIGTLGAADGQLNGPLGVGVDPRNGDVWVADTNNKRVQRFAADGTFKEKVTVTGGPGTQAFTPTDIAVDGEGYLYVLDTQNTRVVVFKDAPAPPPNQSPTPVEDTLVTREDTPGSVNVLANDSDVDGDAVTVTAAANGARGTVTCAAAGTCTYSPSKDYNGTDSFTYTVTDSRGATATGTTRVTVTPVDDPVATPPAPKPTVSVAKPTPLVIGPPQTIRVGAATISAPKKLSLTALKTAKCVNVKVTSKKPVQVLVTIYSGRNSLRLFGKELARLPKAGTTTVCVPVPKRAHTFRPRDGLTLEIRSAGLSRVGLEVKGVSGRRVPIGLGA
jgi:sugar lactone lactonase YvrE